MRVLFIGGTKRGYLALKGLIDNGINVVGIICLRQDEHELERYEEAIETLALRLQIPYYSTKWLKDRDYVSIVTNELRADLGCAVGCRILIPREVYTAPPLGTVAAHDSLLPEYRGFAPLNWSIINGENHTGVTLFYLNDLMDGGDIIAQSRVPIEFTDTAADLYERVCQATVELVVTTLPAIAAGVAARAPQDYAAGSFTCSRSPNDGEIDWRESTLSIYNQIRALTQPYPGAFAFHRGRRLFIWSARPLESPPHHAGRIPGRVVGRTESEVQVLTGDGVLRILEVGSRADERLPAASILRSVRETLGLSRAALLERIELLELGSERHE